LEGVTEFMLMRLGCGCGWQVSRRSSADVLMCSS
jgi:hypothetical protein